MSRPFKIYRIVCALTDKALVSGSDQPVWYGGQHPSGRPLPWHCRGSWSSVGGAFWKTENSVRKHLQNLCHDWMRKSRPHAYPRYPNQTVSWTEPTPGGADWSRLRFLRVEQIYISTYATTLLTASDFMGMAVEDATFETATHPGEGQ